MQQVDQIFKNKPADSYELGSLILKTKSKIVLYHAKPIDISERAYRALLLFCENPGQVLSSQTLMEFIWPDRYVSDASLFKVIQELRELLTKYGAEDHVIKNIRSKGYVFELPINKHTKSFTKTTKKVTYAIGAIILVGIWVIATQHFNPQPKVDEISIIETLQSIQNTNQSKNFDKVLLSIFSNPSNYSQPVVAEAYLARGIRRLTRNKAQASCMDLQTAIKKFNQLEAMRNTAISQFYLGRCMRKNYQIQLSRETYYLALSKFSLLNEIDYELRVKNALGILLEVEEKYDQALPWFIELAKEAEKKQQYYSAAAAWGNAASIAGVYDEKKRFLKNGFDIALKYNFSKYLSIFLVDLAEQSILENQFLSAIDYSLQVLNYSVEANQYPLAPFALNILAYNACLEKNYHKGLELAKFSEVILKRHNHAPSLLGSYGNRGFCYFLQKDYDAAIEIYKQADSMAVKTNNLYEQQEFLAYLSIIMIEKSNALMALDYAKKVNIRKPGPNSLIAHLSMAKAYQLIKQPQLVNQHIQAINKDISFAKYIKHPAILNHLEEFANKEHSSTLQTLTSDLMQQRSTLELENKIDLESIKSQVEHILSTSENEI